MVKISVIYWQNIVLSTEENNFYGKIFTVGEKVANVFVSCNKKLHQLNQSLEIFQDI